MPMPAVLLLQAAYADTGVAIGVGWATPLARLPGMVPACRRTPRDVFICSRLAVRAATVHAAAAAAAAAVATALPVWRMRYVDCSRLRRELYDCRTQAARHGAFLARAPARS